MLSKYKMLKSNEEIPKIRKKQPINATGCAEITCAMVGNVDSGKCFAARTPIMMYDGTTKLVEKIKIDDMLMGDDGTPRKILSTIKGEDQLYYVRQNHKLKNYIVTAKHILCLTTLKCNTIWYNYTINKWILQYAQFKKIHHLTFSTYEQARHSLQYIYNSLNYIPNYTKFNLTVDQYLKLPKAVQKVFYGYQANGLEFDSAALVKSHLKICPYVLGVWLESSFEKVCYEEIAKKFFEYLSNINGLDKYLIQGQELPDSTDPTHNIITYRKNPIIVYNDYIYAVNLKKFNQYLQEYGLCIWRHIPKEYKYSSKQIRYQLLAGIIDSAGIIQYTPTSSTSTPSINRHISQIQFLESLNQISFIIKERQLRDDIIWLVRSLGFHIISEAILVRVNQYQQEIQWVLTLYGNLYRIPSCRYLYYLKSQSSKKYNLVSPIDIKPYKHMMYYGFTTDGNQQFLLSDFTVSHNSTTVGILTQPKLLDNGKGLARAHVLIHKHEHTTGNTSDISYCYYHNIEQKKIYTFIDLAGHEKYLRTTITGISNNNPDCAIICISDKITKMTIEHLQLLISLKIPYIVNFTKTDFILPIHTKKLIDQLKNILRPLNYKLFEIQNDNQINIIHPNEKIIPYLLTSNKTGRGINLLRNILNIYPKRHKTPIRGFIIEHIFNVRGVGTVVSGYTGCCIQKGSKMFLGPIYKNQFIPIKIKSIHNDYYYEVDQLGPNVRGCLCLVFQEKKFLRCGLIISPQILPVYQKFQARVKLFHHHTTIKSGYNTYVHCGCVKENVVFDKIMIYNRQNKQLQEIQDSIRSGDEAYINMQFNHHFNYLEIGQEIIFREDKVKGFGVITQLII